MAVEFKDYYKSLGVARNASDDDIRKAFRKLARQYHPDVAKDKAGAEERFKEINEAYDVLSDPAKRRKYDALGADWDRAGGPPPGWQQAGRGQAPGGGQPFEFRFGGTGFSDFFERFFGGGAGFSDFEVFTENAGRGGRPGGPGRVVHRGSDVEGDLMVTLHEAFSGSVRSVTLQRVNPETGAASTHSFRVRIPAGVQDGQTIRVAGQGGEGAGGGPPGDLYLHVRLARHPDFQVRGRDLYHEADLAPWEAVLGAEVNVPTLEGSVSVRIPPGTGAGHQLRIRGRGLPGPGEVRGDLYVVVRVQTPSEISEPEREAWRELARISKFNPRGS